MSQEIFAVGLTFGQNYANFVVLVHEVQSASLPKISNLALALAGQIRIVRVKPSRVTDQ